MRPFFSTLLPSAALFGAFAGYSQLIANSRFLAHSHAAMQQFAHDGEEPDVAVRAELVAAMLHRAHTYEATLERTHLVDGMLVNRDAHGAADDICDSLLFSGLRFAALKKLGFQKEAAIAWTAIEQSRKDGSWVRHPRCSERPTSRDMIMGLLIALSQNPQNERQHVQHLVEQIDRHGGYFSFGPRYVSYLTPTIARLLRFEAHATGVASASVPDLIRDGYSVEELSVSFIRHGFEAHLVGLAAWLEMEMLQTLPELRAQAGAPLLANASVSTSWLTGANLDRQRLQWTTLRLLELDPQNIFFRYLRLRAADALTYKTVVPLARELLRMPQFPTERLPSDCDRTADYLWQRGPWEHEGSSICGRTYSGTDFLWMAGLLTEALIRIPR